MSKFTWPGFGFLLQLWRYCGLADKSQDCEAQGKGFKSLAQRYCPLVNSIISNNSNNNDDFSIIVIIIIISISSIIIIIRGKAYGM